MTPGENERGEGRFVVLWEEKPCLWDWQEGKEREDIEGEEFGLRNVVKVGFWGGPSLEIEGRRGERDGGAGRCKVMEERKGNLHGVWLEGMEREEMLLEMQKEKEGKENRMLVVQYKLINQSIRKTRAPPKKGVESEVLTHRI